MKTVMLVLKLGGLGGDYDLLGKRLSELNAELREAGPWILRTDCPIDALRTDIQQYLHPHDQILIIELERAA